jgi:hypothetical protein
MAVQRTRFHFELEQAMSLHRRKDAESQRYWESVDRIAREAERQRETIRRENAEPRPRDTEQRDCGAEKKNV